MREFVFRLLSEERVTEREKEPCADEAAARAFAREVAEALERDGWLSGIPDVYLSVLDDRGNEIFKEPILSA